MKKFELTEGGTIGLVRELTGKCNVCGTVGHDTIYDTRVPKYGQWGYLCEDCFDDLECKLGIGLGQKFVAM